MIRANSHTIDVAAGTRGGHRPQCPPAGCTGCRHHLPRYDLCALTCAEMGPLTQEVVAELMGCTRQRIQQIEKNTLAMIRRPRWTSKFRVRRRLETIWALGFEHGWRKLGTRMIRQGAV